MIPFDAIEKVRRVIAHQNSAVHACADGRAAAMIALDAFRLHRGDAPGVEFASYVELRQIEARPGDMLLDIAPDPDDAPRWRDAGTIVIDHHDKRREVVLSFGDRGAYGAVEDGESGATLALRHVWLSMVGAGLARSQGREANARRFAELAAIRDTWRSGDPWWDEASEQAEGLRVHRWHRLVGVPDPFGAGWPDLAKLLEVGVPLWQDKKARAREIAASASPLPRFSDAIGARAVACSTLETSDAADLADADVLVGFGYGRADGKTRLTISMRSRSDVDVGRVAVAIGGGGHRHAAGCTVSSPDRDPYEALDLILAKGATIARATPEKTEETKVGADG